MKWLLVLLMVAATTVGEVLQAAPLVVAAPYAEARVVTHCYSSPFAEDSAAAG